MHKPRSFQPVIEHFQRNGWHFEAVLKFLAGDGCPIAPVFPARNHLAQGVIGVNPIRAVGQCRPGALVGAVVEGASGLASSMSDRGGLVSGGFEHVEQERQGGLVASLFGLGEA